MKHIIITAFLASIFTHASALTISEVMSDPVGVDAGREWVEIYNETESPVDVSTLTISIKGATAVAVAPIQGGILLPSHSYAIVASIISNTSPQTKFLDDYPLYDGAILKVAKSITLVNSGTSSIDLKLGGVTVASLSSYTPVQSASEIPLTLSYIDGNYVTGTPTPGTDNRTAETIIPASPTNATTTENQTTLPQMSPPSPDITIYMPNDKVVVAGAESEFAVFSMTRGGKSINDLRYTWAFGDGGQGAGSSTKYRYAYSGRYIAQVEATSATISGKGRMAVRVVQPDIFVTSFASGKYGPYVEIRNPNAYDLELSQWMLTIDGAAFPFPKNTLLSAGATTRFSGLAMGFASTTIATSTIVKILFPNLEEVTRFISPPVLDALGFVLGTSTIANTVEDVSKATSTRITKPATKVIRKITSTSTASMQISSTSPRVNQAKSSTTKDKRIVTWFKSMFSR